MEQYDLLFIDKLFKEYYGREDLAVKRCKPIKFFKKNVVKKIAMHYRRLSLGGVERVISLLTPMFLEMGYEVVIITEEVNSVMDYDFPPGVEIVTIPKNIDVIRSKNYIRRAAAIQEIIKNKKIDAVCYHEASSRLLLYDFLSYKQSLVNFILVKHEYISQCMVGLMDTVYYQKYIFPLMDKIVVLSNVEKLFWETMGANVEYIYNPVGEYALKEGEKKVTGKSGKNILWIGRLANLQKQYFDIVPIMKEVIKKVPDATMKIYGSESDDGAIEMLNNMIITEHLEKNVKYCGYVVKNIDDVYANVDVHLMTSAYESFPMVIYESRVNGIPLVLYQMPYLEMLKGGKGYIAVENDDISEAAEAIVRILTKDELRQKMAEEALESAALFNNTDLKLKWKNIFNSFSKLTHQEEKTKQDTEDKMKIILDTMLYHYHKGYFFNQNHLREIRESLRESCLREKVTSLVSVMLKNRNLPIVIYPYGKQGKKVKEILNQTLNIQEAFVVDNNLIQDEIEIKTVRDLKNLDCSKYWFLLCSNNKKNYHEIRKCLNEVVPFENIVDLFPQI